MVSPFNLFEVFPAELQLSILEKLDGESLLAARSSCRLWRNLTDKVMEAYFKEECSSLLYVHNGYGNASNSDKGRLNIRIVLAAKAAWKTALKPVQYKKIRPLLAHEMGQPRPLFPVSVRLQGSNFFLFSEEGSREQATPLKLKKEGPLTIEVAKEGLLFGELPIAKMGVVKEVHQGRNGLYLLTEKDSSLYLVIENTSLEVPSLKIDLKLESALSYSLTEGRLLLGLADGALLDYRFTQEGSLTLANTLWHPQPVRWVQSLSEGGTACLSGDALTISFPWHEVSEYPAAGISGLPALLNNCIVLLQPNGDLVSLNPSLPPGISSIREGVSSCVSLGMNSLLLTTQEGVLERRSTDQLLSHIPLPEQSRLLAACMREGLIAAAFTSGEVAVFEEREGALVKIYSTDCLRAKAPVHALLFSKTLELSITTQDGGIFSICPFPKESAEEMAPESFFDTIRRLLSFC